MQSICEVRKLLFKLLLITFYHSVAKARSKQIVQTYEKVIPRHCWHRTGIPICFQRIIQSRLITIPEVKLVNNYIKFVLLLFIAFSIKLNHC